MTQLANTLWSHLPRIRLPDTLIGGGVGAGAGLLGEWLTRPHEQTPEQKRRRQLMYALGGLAAGAGAGNLAGDRTRRYISNTVLPYAYKAEGAASPSASLSPLKPEGGVDWKKLYEGAILDRPTDVLKSNMRTESMEGGKPHPFWERMFDARREIFRRQLGVHTDNATADIFAPNNDGSVSLNAANPKIKEFMAQLVPQSHLKGVRGKVSSPADIVRLINEGGLNRGLLNSVVGGQRAALYPNGHDVVSMRDRWDVTLGPKEQNWLSQVPGKALRNPGWLKEKPDMAADYGKTYQNNQQQALALLQRSVLDNVLTYENPWVTQKGVIGTIDSAKGQYEFLPLTGEGKAYPGIGPQPLDYGPPQ